MATITCSHADHEANSGYPGWVTELGEVSGETAPDHMICPGCTAANLEESLAEAKCRCVGDAKTWMRIKLASPDHSDSLSAELTACDTAITAINAAADTAAAEAARDAYVGS